MKTLTAVVFAVMAGTCLAQSSIEVSGSGGGLLFGGNPVGYQGFGSGNVPANAVHMNGGWMALGRFTLNTGRWLAHEPGMAYSHHTLGMDFNNLGTLPQRRTTWLLFYDLLVCATEEEASFRPCAAVGGHMARYDSPETLSELSDQNGSRFGVNFGGTAKFRVARNFLVRVDVRDYMNPKPFGLLAKQGWLHQIEASAGFGLRF
jgi:hypothetical protein